MSVLKRPIIAFVLALLYPPMVSAAEDLEDLLEARWFDIEVIVFERLDVLDVNTSETLTLTSPRQWPQNLTSLFADAIDPLIVSEQPFNFDAIDPACLGYPTLLEEDPLHPLLQPVTEFSDASLAALENRDTDIDVEATGIEATDAEATDEEATNEAGVAASDIQADPAASLPLNTPTLVMTPYLKLLADVAAYEAELFARAYQPVQPRALTNHVKALNRQRHLRPILHEKWRQPVPPRDAPTPIRLRAAVDDAAPLTTAGDAKVDGFVSVTVGRYLHFAPTLWYHADTLGMAPVVLPASVGSINQVLTRSATPYMAIAESRRMRSGELHYIDHPKLGILVKIEPVAFPPEIEAAWDALDASDRAQ